MSKNRKINYNRRDRSLFSSIWEFITGILGHRIQWKRLKKRSVTPNYYYLTSSSYDQVIPTDYCNTTTAKLQDPVKFVVDQQDESTVSTHTHIEEQPAVSGQLVVNVIQEPANNDKDEHIGLPREEAVVVEIPNMATTLQDEQPITKPTTKKSCKNQGNHPSKRKRDQIPLPFD